MRRLRIKSEGVWGKGCFFISQPVSYSVSLLESVSWLVNRWVPLGEGGGLIQGF